jgi:hypothetical protein
MAKVLLMSVLIMSIFLPAYFARAKNAKVGARNVMVSFAGVTVFWIVFVAYYYKDVLGPVNLDPFHTKENAEKAKWQ